LNVNQQLESKLATTINQLESKIKDNNLNVNQQLESKLATTINQLESKIKDNNLNVNQQLESNLATTINQLESKIKDNNLNVNQQLESKLAANQIIIESQILDSINKLYNEIQSKYIKVDNITTLKIFPKVQNISANVHNQLNPKNDLNQYFIYDKKLYQYNINFTEYTLSNGYYQILISNDNYYEGKSFYSSNGELKMIGDYFDGSKLFINFEEHSNEGSIILTNDYKFNIRLNNRWISK
jgi:hypothetical protein